MSASGYSFVFLVLLSMLRIPDISAGNVVEYQMDGDFRRGRKLAKRVNNEKSPPNRPSVPLTSRKEMNELADARKKTTKYGGALTDPKHVGGFVTNDTDGWEPKLWQYMIDTLHARSVIDIGCGLGVSTTWFKEHGLDTLCVEGSQEAVQNSLVPEITVEHDFSIGPWWPEKNYDIVWCVEFIEHVDFHFIEHYIATMMKAKYIFVSHSIWGGWHHTVVKDDWWWIELFNEWGFVYLPHLTELARKLCPFPSSYKRGNSHFHFRGLVFRNPYYKGDFEMVVTKKDVLKWEKNADPSSFVKRKRRSAENFGYGN